MLKSTKRRNSIRRPLQKISIDKNIHENIISNINKHNKLNYDKFDSGMNTIFNYFDSKIKKVSKPYKKNKNVYITKKPLSINEEKNNYLNNFSFTINYFPQKVNDYLTDIFLYYLSLIKNTNALFNTLHPLNWQESIVKSFPSEQIMDFTSDEQFRNLQSDIVTPEANTPKYATGSLLL